jgi:hypothetical protein
MNEYQARMEMRRQELAEWVLRKYAPADIVPLFSLSGGAAHETLEKIVDYEVQKRSSERGKMDATRVCAGDYALIAIRLAEGRAVVLFKNGSHHYFAFEGKDASTPPAILRIG